MTTTWQQLRTPELRLRLRLTPAGHRSLYLSRDAMRALRQAANLKNGAQLRVTLARNTADPALLAVAYEPEAGAVVDEQTGTAHVTRHTQGLEDVALPVVVELELRDGLLIGRLPQIGAPVPMSKELWDDIPPRQDATLRGLIHRASTEPITVAEPVHEDTYHDDEDDDLDDDEGGYDDE